MGSVLAAAAWAATKRAEMRANEKRMMVTRVFERGNGDVEG